MTDVKYTEYIKEETNNTPKTVFINVADLQRETYELMFQMGWYILEKADQKKIQDKYSTLNQEFTNLKS